MADSDLLRYSGRAEGRVQGVGFRMYVQQHAMDLGITGWVRNMDDGSVTMELQGSPEKLDRLEQIIRRGNAFIKVTGLSLETRPVQEEERRFSIKY